MSEHANEQRYLTDVPDEMNDYEDGDDEEEEYEDEEYEKSLEEEEKDFDLVERFAHAAFGDYLSGHPPATSAKALSANDEQLLTLLQQRLSMAYSGDPTRTSAKEQTMSPQCSLQEFMRSRQVENGNKSRESIQRSLERSFASHLSRINAKSGEKKISPTKAHQLVNRLKLWDEKKARKLNAKRHEAEVREKSGFSYAPTLNSKSRRLTQKFPAFMERQSTHLMWRTHKLTRHQQQLELERSRDRKLDLEANVKTPCICSHGNTLRSDDCASAEISPLKSHAHAGSSGDSVAKHSKSCQRFMEMCRKMNESYAIQKKKDQMKRSIDDMMAYHEEKKLRQQARAEIALELEAQETTFTPQINPNSERIYAALVKSGRLDADFSGRLQRSRQTGHPMPKLTFQPTISKRSKWILKKKRERMSSAIGEVNDSRKASSRKQSDNVINSFDSNVFLRLQDQQQSKFKQPNSPHKIDRTPEEPQLPPIEWNVINYNEDKHGFILQGFELPVAFPQ